MDEETNSERNWFHMLTSKQIPQSISLDISKESF